MKKKERKRPVTFAQAAARIRKEQKLKSRNKSLGYQPTDKPFKNSIFNPFLVY